MPKTKPNLSPWMPRLVTLCWCALAAASAVAWALRVQGLQSTASVVPVALATASHAEPAVVAKALGAMATGGAGGADVVAPVLESSRFVLVGVVASGAQGAALIAVDGKPAKPYPVGATVGDTFVLQSVQARQAVLGRDRASEAELKLTMPAIGDRKSH
jgi:general secretion pathway protein C